MNLIRVMFGSFLPFHKVLGMFYKFIWHNSIHIGHAQVVDILLGHTADVHRPNQYGATPLTWLGDFFLLFCGFLVISFNIGVEILTSFD